MINSVTCDMKRAARRVNLYQFLCTYHSSDIIRENRYIRLKEHDSICIHENSSGYVRFSTQSETGNAIDLLTRYLSYTFVEAVQALITADPGCVRHVAAGTESALTPGEPAVFSLPEPSAQPYSRVYAYLTKTRGISYRTVNALVDAGLIYQDASHGNAVFLNRQKDYCDLRGTYTLGSPFHGCRRMDASGHWFFQVGKDEPVRIAYICESAIDAISLYELHRHQGMLCKPAMYCSIGGVSNQKAIDRIVSEGYRTVVAVDNDSAGDACRTRNNKLESIIPQHKDWNEDLLSLQAVV